MILVRNSALSALTHLQDVEARASLVGEDERSAERPWQFQFGFLFFAYHLRSPWGDLNSKLRSAAMHFQLQVPIPRKCIAVRPLCIFNPFLAHHESSLARLRLLEHLGIDLFIERFPYHVERGVTQALVRTVIA